MARTGGPGAWDVKSFLLALVVFLSVRIFLVEAYRIPSPSMVPTLLVGDWLFVNKLIYGPNIPFTDVLLPGYAEPHHGDVVVFKSPTQIDQPNDPNPTLVKRLIGLIPPRGAHLTTFFGVFASNAKARPQAMRAPLRQSSAPLPKPQHKLALSPPHTLPPRPRLDWAALQKRTFDADVWACPCGGRRKVLAVITSRRTAEQVLRNMRLLEPRLPTPLAQAPPQLQLQLGA